VISLVFFPVALGSIIVQTVSRQFVTAESWVQLFQGSSCRTYYL